jgi:hypothetical protein
MLEQLCLPRKAADSLIMAKGPHLALVFGKM